MAISSLPWQAITLLVAFVSLLVFLPLVWVRVSLATDRASALLTLLTPAALIAGALLWFGLYNLIYVRHDHLQNELGGFLVTLAPAVTALGAWVLGIVDVLRRRAWGWLAPVALLPWLGTLAYALARRRARRNEPLGVMGRGSLLLAGATLALLSVLVALFIVVAGLDYRYDSTPELFALFGSCVALAAGLCGGLSFARVRQALATALLLLSALLGTQLVTGATFPVQDPLAPHWARSVTLSVFGHPASELAGLWVTLGLITALAALELACAIVACSGPRWVARAAGS